MALTEAAASLISAGIAAGGAVTSAGINAGAAAIRNRKQWKYWKKQHAISLQDWDMMNQYNSPKAQMSRFMAAGLNPNLIYGQQNTTSELNSPPPPQYESPMAAIGEGFQNAISAAQNRYVQMRQLAIQQNNSDALVKLYEAKEDQSRTASALNQARTALQDLQNEAYKRTDFFGTRGNILKQDLANKEQLLKKLIFDTTIANLTSQYLDKTLDNRVRLVRGNILNLNYRNHLLKQQWNYNRRVNPYKFGIFQEQYQQSGYNTSIKKEQLQQLFDRGDWNFDNWNFQRGLFDIKNKIMLNTATQSEWKALNEMQKYELDLLNMSRDYSEGVSRSFRNYLSNFKFKLQ